jgi:cation diffusion facilitator family transporter
MTSPIPQHATPRDKERTAVSGVIAGGVDTGITAAAMIAASSAVLLADLLKTALDFVAVLLSWLALRRIHRAKRAYFAYGLEKLEDLSGLFIGLLMLASLIVIVVNAIMNLLHPSHIEGVGLWISMGAQVAYAVINTRLCVRNRRILRHQNSPVVAAQVRLFFVKALANVFILLSLGTSMLLAGYDWSRYIDPVASMAIAVSMILPTVGTFSSSVNDLLDRSLEESHKLGILRELGPFICEFTDLHDIRVRRAGSLLYVDIELEFDPDRRVGEVQQIVTALKRNIEHSLPSSRLSVVLSPAPASEHAAKEHQA